MMPLAITYRNPKELTPAVRNARTHSAAQIAKIAQSIQSFGFNNPVLLDSQAGIVAGHGRVSAALSLGLDEVPTVRLDHLTPAQRRAYVIADNRIAELAGWDDAILAIELQGLLETELDFEITDIGFEMPDIEGLLDKQREDKTDPADDPDLMKNAPSIARRGDLWALGDHRIFCGDALDPLSYAALLGRERAEMVFTDPPYNVPINGHVSGLGKARHAEFVMASGEMSKAQFVEFLTAVSARMAEISADGAIHFICIDWRHLQDLLEAAAATYSEVKNICVWVKSNGGMGSLYRSQHEMIGVFKVGRGKHINNVELGKHGRSRTNVWHYAGMNSFQEGRGEGLAMHPTLKPVALVRDAILDCSSRGGLVLDPFGGAGTTLIAAHQAGRVSRLIELDPHYVDVTLQRFSRLTGIAPVNLWTGERVDCATVSAATGKARS